MRKDQPPRVLSTFTGAGGLDLGLERAGFSIIGCVEKDEQARSTLAANRPEWPLLDPKDIVALAKELQPGAFGLEARELDLIAGGPPCQTFSKAAQWSKNGRAGRCGDCANALDALLTLVGRLLPRCVLLENVPGFVRGTTNVIPYLKEFFEQLNAAEGTSYLIKHRIENAADLGVPQRRQRALIVVLRDGSEIPWPAATHQRDPIRAWDALADLEPHDPPQLTGKWADLIPSIPEGANYQWHTERGGGRNLFGYRRRFWSFLLKLAKDQTSWTLPAQPGPATGPFHWENRLLSVEERLRLQTFPSTWVIAGEHREQVRQVGNATPPLLAELYGRALLKHLENTVHKTAPTLRIERRDNVPPPEATHPVPEKYLCLEGDHEPHPGAGRGPSPVTELSADAEHE